ncbi:hypothetical protein E3C22_01470 [Jiella endophytica]|uniref:Lipocalin-like domain-containing protein n=1 Tax=Jiella endophytica TaxID=2558362 RepID=A0A4Y8RSG6_9HYPH|nr:hypothetical protein [Jiella endophytica]TFF27176.1 hypothetical protein E3C22_01470 [Jiella endophytica]
MDRTRPLTIAGVTLTALLATASASIAAELDCTAFMTGKWVGTGEGPGGSPYELDNTYTFKADGSFETVNRFRSPGKDWSEQAVTGEWTAEPDKDQPDGCAVSMTSTYESDGMSSSSSSVATYVRIDDKTLSTMDFVMHRQD